MSCNWYRGVVVGVDGSEESMGALDWAARTADRHDARLTVLSAYTVPPSPVIPEVGFTVADAREDAQYAIDRALARLGGARPGDRVVQTRIAQGSAPHVLAQEARSCDLVVVGRRGLGPLDRMLLGSVSSALAAGAHGPVAVIPAGASTGDPRRVVVGASRDDDLGLILELAFAEAEQRSCRLEIVHVLEPLGVEDGLDRSGFTAGWREAAATDIGDEVTRWAEKHPAVTSTVTLRTGDAATALLRGLAPDDLVVVGGRRHPQMLGRLLRSVPDKVLRGAPCPVVVVHDHH